MEFLLIPLLLLIPLAMAVGGIALIVNAIDTIKKELKK